MPRSAHVQRYPGTFLGKPRQEWMRYAAKAIISSTDEDMRWQLWKPGFEEFRQQVIPRFDVFMGLKFTADECRWIYWRIEVSIRPIVRELGVAAVPGLRRVTILPPDVPYGTPDIETEESHEKRTVPL